ncbi:MAG: DUF4450 domain-containing protein, partial [Odoribacter sp.]|nr:DUF4450 domain-containing protein [Odoribacter sp.]
MKLKSFTCILLLYFIVLSCSNNPPLDSELADNPVIKERVQRYFPDGEDFVIINGKMKFNRALYGTNTAFRIEAGDLPEFAFYMPGMGGNCQLALVNGDKKIWLNDAEFIESRYRPGSMIYTIKDEILGQGNIVLQALAMAEEEGLILKFDFYNIPQDLKVYAIYGGASDQKFSRDGDLNADPPDSFFLKPRNCRNNHFNIVDNYFSLVYGNRTLTPEEIEAIHESISEGKKEDVSLTDKEYKKLIGSFPTSTVLTLVNAYSIENLDSLIVNNSPISTPVIKAEIPVKNNSILFSLHNPEKYFFLDENELETLYQEAEEKRAALANKMVINTPDKFLNTLGGVISTVGDAIYEYPSYLHGALSWRTRLNGWRGAYVADVLGWHDRARNHFSSYAQSQLTTPLSAPVEMDTLLNLTRSAERLGNAMFSSGYICRNPGGDFRPHHYDMNLVFIDQLINHFNWTGNMQYIREMWSTLERHLAWEKRVFDPDGDGLYDAYACIWASDALMYNSGGVTYSSAYNYKANLQAAKLATLLGKNPEPYEKEAEKILSAINKKLWLENKGWWAEYVDFMGNGFIHSAAGLWTIYHAIDSDIQTPFQAYEALRYIDNYIPHIPFKAEGIENEDYFLLSTTNWMPYSWSVNNVAFAEMMHTALAYWQGERKDKGFKLFKSAVLDAMYYGLSPGNIGQISFYDAARGETYRDFADPVGIIARAVVEGLYGIKPDLLNGRLFIKPRFPQEWDYASLHLLYLDYSFEQREDTTFYSFQVSMQRQVGIELEVPTFKDKVSNVLLNGKSIPYEVNTESMGYPSVKIKMPVSPDYDIQIVWEGEPIQQKSPEIIAAINELNIIQFDADVTELKDTQGLIDEQEISDSHVQVRLKGEPGERTFFAKMKQNEMRWWQPVHVKLGKAVEVIPAENENSNTLDFHIRNNSERDLKGKLTVNPGKDAYVMDIIIAPKSVSELFKVPSKFTQKGTNLVQVEFSGKLYEYPVVNWQLPLTYAGELKQVEMEEYFNDKVTQIFKNKYVSPRSPYTTLQLPVQGIGEWCHPKLTATIDDSGLRKKAVNNIFSTPFGLSFRTPADKNENNILFVSLWDNYPEKAEIPLEGKASHAYLLMAGSTNHMQSQFDNGIVNIYYQDGSKSSLILRNPETWAPIERDYFTDGFAFAMKQPRPYRIVLKTGYVGRNMEDVIRG